MSLYFHSSRKKTRPETDDNQSDFGQPSTVTSTADIKARLVELQLERLEAETNGLVRCKAYMDDLEAEWADQHEALVRATLEEILAFRCEIGSQQYG
jgi:hypothetical protein